MRLSIKRRILKGNKQTPEQYKKSLKNQLDNIERKERNKTGSLAACEPVKEKKKIRPVQDLILNRSKKKTIKAGSIPGIESVEEKNN